MLVTGRVSISSRLNRPKALLISATVFQADQNEKHRGRCVSIARRLCLSLQQPSLRRRRFDIRLSVSIARRLCLSLQHDERRIQHQNRPYSLNRPKALLISATEMMCQCDQCSFHLRSQSPEGSAYLCNTPEQAKQTEQAIAQVSIARRLCLSLQLNSITILRTCSQARLSQSPEGSAYLCNRYLLSFLV